MKSRIIESLTSLSSGISPLSYELKRDLRLTEEELKIRSASVLKNILHNYSSFAIMTIDAFFQKVVRSFAREIGIQGGFEVELDQKKAISEVVDNVLAEIAQNATLTTWLVEFAFYKINNGQSWDTNRDINSLSHELFKELLIRNRDVLFSQMEDDEYLPAFMTSLDGIIKNFEEKLEAYGLQALRIMTEHGLVPQDFSYGLSGVGGYLLKLSNQTIVEPGSRVFAAINEGKWCSKSSDKKGSVDSAVHGGLEKTLAEIIDFWIEGFEKYFTASQVVKNIYTFGLLSEVSRQLNSYREENDLLLISDFPIFLNNIIGNSDTPYIYEKIGAKYKNYLIDEFQDTSGLQWQNFKPLVKDTIDAGRFSMVVGDIKQSIYRWRGGNWKLLLDKIKEDVGEQYSEDIPLNFNWRSKKNIIDFNNALFEKAPDIVHKYLLREAGQEIPEIENIKKAYTEVKQDFVEGEKSEGGLIDFKFLKKTEEEDTDSMALDYLTSTIEQLQDANYNLRDIAILIRNKNDGDMITNALLKHQEQQTNSKYKYEIISNESLFLKNSYVVNFIISVLKVLSNPQEEIFRYELAYAWFVYLNGGSPTNASKIDNGERDPIQVIHEHADLLRQLSLTDQIESIIRLFFLKKYTNQLAYLLAFQDAILDFSSRENKGVGGFLEWWEENKNRAIQVSEDMEAIRLMTIHKSKGLQFKVVIIPFTNWRLDHTAIHDNIIWCDTLGKDPFNALPFVPLKYKKDMNKTLYASSYWEEKVKVYVDHLNLLYVALTRAEEALYVVSEIEEGKKEKLTGVNHLLYHFFQISDFSEKWSSGEDHFTIGQLALFSVYEKNEQVSEYKLHRLISNSWTDREGLAIRTGPQINSEEVMTKINEGVILHFILSKVTLKEDLKNALKLAQVEFKLSAYEVDDIRKKLQSIFEIPEINDWFSNTWEIKNEVNIITESGTVKRPDRVMTKNNDAIVLDFKTGEEKSFYKTQVKEYMTVLRSMGYRSVEGYLLYIRDNKLLTV